MAQTLTKKSRRLPAGAGWRIRKVLGRLHLLESLHRRRFQAYGCGAAKTGTHSIYNIFRNYRTGHEIDVERTIELVRSYLDGSVSNAEIERQLRIRDWKLWLEMDSSLVNAYLVAPLAKVFPAARFILTVREPLSWADSLMDHELNRGRPDFWLKFDEVTWNLDIGYTAHDSALAERGLRPLAAYFDAWTRHNREVLNSAPEDRLLVLRTSEITERLADIAAHVGVPLETLDSSAARSYAAPKKHGILSALNAQYVRDTAERHCGELAKRFFPGILAEWQSQSEKFRL